jgi:hypothetical protein
LEDIFVISDDEFLLVRDKFPELSLSVEHYRLIIEPAIVRSDPDMVLKHVRKELLQQYTLSGYSELASFISQRFKVKDYYPHLSKKRKSRLKLATQITERNCP